MIVMPFVFRSEGFLGLWDPLHFGSLRIKMILTFVWSLAVCKVLCVILVRMFIRGREFQIYQY